MTGFADLVEDASANEGGRLANVEFDGTEGKTWKWTFTEITDHAGTDIDLSAATGECKILTGLDGTVVLALTFAGGVAEFTVSATAAATAGLATGATKSKPRACLWYCEITSGTDVVQFWGPSESNFRIWGE